MPIGYEAAFVRKGPRFGKIDGDPPATSHAFMVEISGEEERAMSQAHPSGPSVIEQLASYASGETFAKLPEATVRAARRAILDTLGVMLAGTREDTAVRARKLIE